MKKQGQLKLISANSSRSSIPRTVMEVARRSEVTQSLRGHRGRGSSHLTASDSWTFPRCIALVPADPLRSFSALDIQGRCLFFVIENLDRGPCTVPRSCGRRTAMAPASPTSSISDEPRGPCSCELPDVWNDHLPHSSCLQSGREHSALK